MFYSCNSCCGSGTETCDKCDGSGQLKWFLQLEVSFVNNVDDFIKKFEAVPDKLLRTCATKNIFAEQNVRVYPVTNHPVQDVNLATQTLITEHAEKYAQCRILMQVSYFKDKIY
jgi:hypothetical protein